MSVPMKDEDIDSTSERSLPEESTYEGDASKRRKEIAILPSSCTRPQPVTLFPVPSGSCVPRIPTQLRWTTPILRSNFTPRELASASHPFFPSFRKQPLHHTFTDLLSRWTTPILRSNFEVKRELASGSHPFLPSFSIKPLLQTFTDLLRPQTDTVFPEPSHTMKSDFPKIQPQSSLSQPQQSTPEPINRRTPLPPNGLIPIHLSHSPSYSRTIFTNKAAGISSRLHWPFTIHRSQESGEFTDEPLNIKNYECDDETFRITKEYFGDASAENEIESISDRSVVPEVFTPESNPYNDRKSYRFPCSSEGLFQCRYTGLVFKMDTGGEVEYRTEPWNYTQLAKRNYVPAGPLFDIKCPQGTLSQIRFPHCEVFSASLIGGCPSVSSPSSAYTPPGQDFFHKHKAALETRLGLLRPILSKLETHRVLNPQEREEVQSKKSNQEQNESLLLMLKKKGGPAQEEFYKVLKECDEYLVKDLEGPYRTYET